MNYTKALSAYSDIFNQTNLCWLKANQLELVKRWSRYKAIGYRGSLKASGLQSIRQQLNYLAVETLEAMNALEPSEQHIQLAEKFIKANLDLNAFFKVY
jgi:hypothetical protein